MAVTFLDPEYVSYQRDGVSLRVPKRALLRPLEPGVLAQWINTITFAREPPAGGTDEYIRSQLNGPNGPQADGERTRAKRAELMLLSPTLMGGRVHNGGQRPIYLKEVADSRISYRQLNGFVPPHLDGYALGMGTAQTLMELLGRRGAFLANEERLRLTPAGFKVKTRLLAASVFAYPLERLLDL